MSPFTVHRGVAVPLQRPNIDTDAIIPSREMKRVSKLGLADGLFANWRYLAPNYDAPNPAFALNQAEYANTTIILAGPNFGCGSSREHAVWALAEYGIRVILAPSFGTIFQQNCIANGVLAATADEADIAAAIAWVQENPQHNQLSVDLQQGTVSGLAQPFGFQIPAADKQKLLAGLDAIGFTLQHETAIAEFEARHFQASPWVKLSGSGSG